MRASSARHTSTILYGRTARAAILMAPMGPPRPEPPDPDLGAPLTRSGQIRPNNYTRTIRGVGLKIWSWLLNGPAHKKLILVYITLIPNLPFCMPFSSKTYHFVHLSHLKPILSIFLYTNLVSNLSFCIPFSSKTLPFVYHSRLKRIFVLFSIIVWNLSFCIPVSYNTCPAVYHSLLKPILSHTTPF